MKPLLLPAILFSATSILRAEEVKPPAAVPPPVKEEEGKPKQKPGLEEPGEAYFQAWLLSRDAEALRANGRNQEAEAKLVRALLIFRGVQHQWPEWKREMLRGRVLQTEEKLKAWGWKEGATV